MKTRSSNAIAIKTFTKRAVFSSGLLLFACITMAWGQTIELQLSSDTETQVEASQSAKATTDTDNTKNDKHTNTTSQTNSDNKNENNRDPIGSSADERFIPTEEISEDLPVSFPVDI